MKKNNVLNVTDLRNPDINRKNVKIPDSVPSKFVDYYVKISLQVAQIRYNLCVLGNIEEYLLFQVEDSYQHQSLDFTLFGKTDHLYLSKDSMLSFLSTIWNNQSLLLESYLHELEVITSKTDDDELPF